MCTTRDVIIATTSGVCNDESLVLISLFGNVVFRKRNENLINIYCYKIFKIVRHNWSISFARYPTKNEPNHVKNIGCYSMWFGLSGAGFEISVLLILPFFRTNHPQEITCIITQIIYMYIHIHASVHVVSFPLNTTYLGLNHSWELILPRDYSVPHLKDNDATNVNTRYSLNVVLMLGQRRRTWTNNRTALGQPFRLVIAGTAMLACWFFYLQISMDQRLRR